MTLFVAYKKILVNQLTLKKGSSFVSKCCFYMLLRDDCPFWQSLHPVANPPSPPLLDFWGAYLVNKVVVDLLAWE